LLRRSIEEEQIARGRCPWKGGEREVGRKGVGGGRRRKRKKGEGGISSVPLPLSPYVPFPSFLLAAKMASDEVAHVKRVLELHAQVPSFLSSFLSSLPFFLPFSHPFFLPSLSRPSSFLFSLSSLPSG
jgi:hypothetical protein